MPVNLTALLLWVLTDRSIKSNETLSEVNLDTRPGERNSRLRQIPQFARFCARRLFLLKDGIFATIDYPGATATIAMGINSQGDIVGYKDPTMDSSPCA
jgi:hypothetical protein